MTRELLGRTLAYLADVDHPFVMPCVSASLYDSEKGVAIIVRQLTSKVCSLSGQCRVRDRSRLSYARS